MPEIITYSLRASHNNSDEYYQTISAFSTEVLAHAFQQVPELLGSFQSWNEHTPHISPRDREETVFELLSLGVLWRVYTPSALASRAGARRFLTWLAVLRKRSDILKPGVDLLRGWLGGLLSLHKKPNHPAVPPTLKNMDVLLEWLRASGEFSEDVKRLKAWREFFASLSPGAVSPALQEAIDLAGWFESHSLERLGEYTGHVETFLSNTHPRYHWREDNLFTGRQRVEYHLNMLGSELLNRSLRAGFLETTGKIVIVPPCLKAQTDEECQAKSTPYGERCANCTPGCRVNQVTRLGEKHGFQVFMIPDQLKVFSGDRPELSPGHSVGLVGVSCPLTNASGGWEIKSLGVPAQGLLLDYCGCSYHWHKVGIPTDINLNQLLRLMDDSP
ncbi:MAG: hypothetical protein A2X25_02890 [Chloroflexi bacterium GWB2_49_20]|nr:MAG: hypothetical protein A2X25_02890 [Chloroflexi bacterium GWB2_49_20]OGN78796.1 MAG: hypothetical protein A2X26_12890 [Chloroflexi bacterium GWC2_49_37]OGN85899.1 MAG: hypothetical protein A2X27_11795 [Chloroflexi bacterium GWD2_49_16]